MTNRTNHQTNREWYSRTFDTLAPKRDFLANLSAPKRRARLPRTVVAALVALAMAFGGVSAYAANLGGIKRQIQLWIHGDQTNATLAVKDDGSYTLRYRDRGGKTREQAGGGVVMEAGGKERPATAAEIEEHLKEPDLEETKDGRVLVEYGRTRLDITDRFKNGVCYVKLTHGGKVLYMTVKRHGGYAISPDAYIAPDRFNVSHPED